MTRERMIYELDDMGEQVSRFHQENYIPPLWNCLATDELEETYIEKREEFIRKWYNTYSGFRLP